LAFSTASSSLFSGSWPPGITGTPQEVAMTLALSLSPIFASTEEGGPMKQIPLSSQAFAKAAFSDRKP
jgi:hypothetical protein